MTLVSYLGLQLKSDAVVDLLEDYAMEVMYQFDRLHENTADAYSSTAQSAGFELRFNEYQILDTVWCYVKERDGFSAIDPDVVGVPCYSSFKEAWQTAEASGIRTSRPPSGSEAWIRLEEDGLWRHYEFIEDELGLITLMLPWE